MTKNMCYENQGPALETENLSDISINSDLIGIDFESFTSEKERKLATSLRMSEQNLATSNKICLFANTFLIRF